MTKLSLPIGVTDIGLKEVARLQSISGLFLSDTNITDAGLRELAALGNLKILHVSNTKVTKEGVQELEKAIPKCKIFH